MVVAGFKPDYAVPPGWALEEVLEDRSMSQADLARHTGLSEKHISQILKGEAPISVDTARRLEIVTDIPAQLWSSMEHVYRSHLARLANEEKLSSQIGFLEKMPIEAMVRMGLLTKRVKPIDRLQEIFEFFGVADADAWDTVWGPNLQAASYRKKPGSDPGSLAVWLRLGEKAALNRPSQPWNAAEFKESLFWIRSLTTEREPAVWYPKLVDECAQSGVVIVVVPEVKGTKVNGATRWLTPDRVLLQLSLRHKTNDVFWFSFFHEACHVLDEKKRPIFVQGLEDRQTEQRADKFAQDFLIPPQHIPLLRNLNSLPEVEKFSKDIGIHPGIAVGRLQHDKVWSYTNGNNLKQFLELATEV